MLIIDSISFNASSFSKFNIIRLKAVTMAILILYWLKLVQVHSL